MRMPQLNGRTWDAPTRPLTRSPNKSGHGRSGSVSGEDTERYLRRFPAQGAGSFSLCKLGNIKCERERCAAMRILCLREGEQGRMERTSGENDGRKGVTALEMFIV